MPDRRVYNFMWLRPGAFRQVSEGDQQPFSAGRDLIQPRPVVTSREVMRCRHPTPEEAAMEEVAALALEEPYLANLPICTMETEHAVAREGEVQRPPITIDRRVAAVKGMIVYPALMTPAVHVGEPTAEDYFELLIVTKGELRPEHVNRQLKISIGMSPRKPFRLMPLFSTVDQPTPPIEVELIGEMGNLHEVRTHEKFVGILRRDVQTRITDLTECDQLYKVRVRGDVLPTDLYYDAYMSRRSSHVIKRYRTNGEPEEVSATVGLEESDSFIRRVLLEIHGERSSIQGRGLYGFRRRDGDVQPAAMEDGEPIQSYHPLCIVPQMRNLDVGFISDIHVNSRSTILGKSPARVIEADDVDQQSPVVGQMLMETNRSYSSVLGQIATACDAVVVGGDLIDHVRNAYTTLVNRDMQTHEVWNAVDLIGNYNAQTHPPGVDLVAFYSLTIDVMRSSARPFFALTGNHDAYQDPYGISPRIAYKRANEGIAADVNRV